MIHFKCSLKINSLIKKTENIIGSLIYTHVEFENFNEENQIETSTRNTSQYKSLVFSENEIQTSNSCLSIYLFCFYFILTSS